MVTFLEKDALVVRVKRDGRVVRVGLIENEGGGRRVG